MSESPSSRGGAPKLATRAKHGLRRIWRKAPAYFSAPVSFSVAFPPLLLLSIVLFTRSLWTNYIFDEQEALLANPYVNGSTLGFWDVFSRDFWGLPPNGTIGSYRPLPNIIWRLLWSLRHHAWLPHWFNVVFHGVNGALVAVVAYRWLASARAAWFSGVGMVTAAVITEAVCGVVGIADVLCGTFILLTLLALKWRWWWHLPTTFAFMVLGLFSKESTLTAIPMVSLASLILAPLDRGRKVYRFRRFFLVTTGAVLALVFYTYFRRHFFPVTLPAEYQKALPETEPFARRLMHDFLRWFQQPNLPKDPINNPLVDGDTAHRVSGALRVYWRGLTQVVFPWTLSGDYSFPQEPVPKKLLTWESVLGGSLMILPPLAGLGFWGRSLWLEFRERWVSKDAALSFRVRSLAVVALCLCWIPITYFPHSNIPLLLPTVRAERFWYIPVIASSWGFGMLFDWVWRRFFAVQPKLVWGIIIAFFGFQALQARLHALDYRSDLVFWQSTARAVPNSAKAHLNYGVMLGARRRYDERLAATGRAKELAPKWPMAHIYYGDTLCRMKKAEEAWPHYKKGFELGPNQQGLIGLALQCLWDEKAVKPHENELKELAEAHPGTWLAYLANDIRNNGEKHNGVDPKYRPRGYDQGPRDEKKKKKKKKSNATSEAAASADAGDESTD